MAQQQVGCCRVQSRQQLAIAPLYIADNITYTGWQGGKGCGRILWPMETAAAAARTFNHCREQHFTMLCIIVDLLLLLLLLLAAGCCCCCPFCFICGAAAV
jgi:hypothetical protein